MSYDGFYADLSTRVSINRLLQEAMQIKADIEELKKGIEDRVEHISSAYNSAEKAIYLPYQAPKVTAYSNGVILDLAPDKKYTMYRVILNGEVPINFINQIVPPGKWKSFELHLVQGTGGDTVSSWPGNIVWNGGGDAPRLSKSIGDVDKITFTTSDGGASWQGQYARLYNIDVLIGDMGLALAAINGET